MAMVRPDRPPRAAESFPHQRSAFGTHYRDRLRRDLRHCCVLVAREDVGDPATSRPASSRSNSPTTSGDTNISRHPLPTSISPTHRCYRREARSSARRSGSSSTSSTNLSSSTIALPPSNSPNSIASALSLYTRTTPKPPASTPWKRFPACSPDNHVDHARQLGPGDLLFEARP